LLNLLRTGDTLGFKDILPLFLNHLFCVVGVPFIYLFVSVLIWVSASDTGSLFHVELHTFRDHLLDETVYCR
jgi:hypothetical protein